MDPEDFDNEDVDEGGLDYDPQADDEESEEERNVRCEETRVRLGVFDKYSRPPITIEELRDKEVELMILDVDYDFEKADGGKKAYIRIFGLDNEQNTFMVKVTGFLSYLYIKMPSIYIGKERELDLWLQSVRFPKKKKVGTALAGYGSDETMRTSYVKYEIVKKESLMNYKHPGMREQQFVKIYYSDPKDVERMREYLQVDGRLPGGSDQSTYESNLPYPLKFMVEKKFSGMGWFRIIDNDNCDFQIGNHDNRMQVMITTHHENLEVMDAIDGDELDPCLNVAPIRILSFDIECDGRGNFPTAEKDPVITIAAVGKLHNSPKEDFRVVLQLGSCSPVAGVDLQTFNDECDLFRAFEELVQVFDPDILLGYNITGFDLDYMIKRAEVLSKKQQDGPPPTRWTRIKGEGCRKKRDKPCARPGANRETGEFLTTGRVCLDMLNAMISENKLLSYSLNYVSTVYLGEQKEDVNYALIHSLMENGPDTRRRIATYCLKDALLPLRLLEKLKNLYNYIEMARVTGVPFTMLFTRGQQIRVLTQIHREASTQNMVVPYVKPTQRQNPESKTYKGATVFEPKAAFYKDPVLVLDFAALYPSIMIAYNVCYSTLWKMPAKPEPNSFSKSPVNSIFVKEHMRKGVLPTILKSLLQRRAEVKEHIAVLRSQVNRTKDEKVKAEMEMNISLLDARQNALKTSANAVYGFTGAEPGLLPCLEVATSVVEWGREMLQSTSDHIESKYGSKAPQAKQVCDIIYGDTDSVMIHYLEDDKVKAMAWGHKVAEEITARYPKPIRLEMQKMYYPYLLLCKKRYSGLVWKNPDKWICREAKGIETVRRDSCLMVRKAIEKVLDILMNQISEEKAKSYIRSLVHDVLSGRIDMSELVISKTLTKTIDFEAVVGEREKAYKVNTPHVSLAMKLQKRNPDNPPAKGDRIPYVILQGKADAKLFEVSEDPVFAMEKQLPLNYEYYVDHQLKPPISRLFKVFSMYSEKDSRDIFGGDHSKQNVNHGNAVTNSGIGLYFTPSAMKCMACSLPLNRGASSAVCERCYGKIGEVYLEWMFTKKTLQDEYRRLWTECQRCKCRFSPRPGIQIPGHHLLQQRLSHFLPPQEGGQRPGGLSGTTSQVPGNGCPRTGAQEEVSPLGVSRRPKRTEPNLRRDLIKLLGLPQSHAPTTD